MKKINFYIEENVLIRQLIDIEQKNQDLKDSITIMEKVSETDVCTLFVPPDFYSICFNNKTIAEIIYAQEHDGDVRDTLMRLNFAIDKAETCQIVDQALSVGAANLFQAGFGALIAVGGFSSNGLWSEERMMLVVAPHQVKLALRKLYIVAKIPESLFLHYCSAMFDNLYFHAPPEQIKALGLRYDDVIGKVITHFSYLNDYAMQDFESFPQPHEIIQRARAHGVEISPESPNTHRNRRAMSERVITIEGEPLCCEWHTKFESRQGRIHFYARRTRPNMIKLITGEKVIVGIITNHLT